MKPTLQTSVRALVDSGLRSGDLLTEFVGSGRSLEGIRAHQKIQHARPAGYTAEVPVAHLFETDDLALTISGRIDGVYGAAQPPIIDEIKSTRRELSGLEREPNRLHWGQAQCYAYIYAASHGLDAIDVQLTYFHLESGAVREIRQHFGRDELERFFGDLVGRYLKRARMQAKWNRRRDTAIEDLAFPFPHYRPGQRRLAVERCIGP